MRRLPVISVQADARGGDFVPMPLSFGRDPWVRLRDRNDRVYSYLRLSLTDRCDLACVYCMPPGGEEDHSVRGEMLDRDEVVRLVRVLARGGIRRVRLTGGEPLVRKDIVDIVGRVRRDAGIDEIVMTTNGTRLAELAKPLRDAGLAGVNVSIDSFDVDTFRRVTRGGDLDQVLRGVEAALAVGLSVKTNTVVLRGDNDHELADIVRRVWAWGATPRFIELMPIGIGASILDAKHVPVSEMIPSLALVVAGTKDFESGAGPARYMMAIDGTKRRVGFITALSENFCDSCNRIRVTSNGSIRACLATRRSVSLRDAMRSGASDAELLWAVHSALSTKEASHHFEDSARVDHREVGMSLVGG